MKQEQRFFVFHLHGVVVDHVIGMAVRENEIDQTVVVIVEIFEAPTAQQPCRLRDIIRLRHIAKGLVFIVLVDGKHLMIDIRDEQILPAVSIEVGGIHSHSRTRLPAFAEAHASLQRNFFPFPASIRSRSAVQE